ncbi:MAG: cellulase family glycosylhydrolase [Oscillospiraceae bacterium]|nr:cellulase family glycosylhydrolase [Oscillospiraceae bacterium]
MRLLKRLMAGVSALALSFSMAASAGTALPTVAADDTNDDWLHAVGSRLYDSQGNEVWLTGANWFGFNCSENCLHGLNTSNNADDMLRDIAEHGINVLRFPISSELLKSWMDGKPHEVSSVQAVFNPPQDVIGEDGSITPAGAYGDINREFVEADGKTLKNSMEIFDVVIRKCKENGLKVIIDIHSPDANNSGHNYELWYGKAGITTEIWQDTLVWLAKKYANDDTIIGYDLKNEPHGKRGYTGDSCPSDIAKWDGSTDENNWAYAATNCAEAILDVNPNALIFIEGVEQYPITEKGYTCDTPDVWEPKTEDDKRWNGAWWGGNLRGVKDYPITMSTPEKQSKIVYSPHDYGTGVYTQTWFHDGFDTQSLLDEYWYDTWVYINDKDIAPLLIGEWGGFVDGGKNEQWMRLLQQYMIDHHINHTYWCLNPNSGDTGGLFDYGFTTWDKPRYEILEKVLWQTDAGKYIGLDHQTPLGGEGSTTGLSLTQFYASGEGSNLDAGGEKHAQDPDIQPTDPKPTETDPVPSETDPAPSETDPAPSETDPAPTPGKVTLCGDVDESGKVDILDVIVLNKNLMTGEALTAQGKRNAITTGETDRNPDAMDALNILKYVVEIYDSLPV